MGRPHSSTGARLERKREVQLTVLVYSSDDSLSSLVESAVPPRWEVARCNDVLAARECLGRTPLRVIIFDDDGVDGNTRGWMQAQIRRSAPDALKVYVASAHSEEGERRARASGAHYYTAKPVDRYQFLRVVRAFFEAQQSRSARES